MSGIRLSMWVRVHFLPGLGPQGLHQLTDSETSHFPNLLIYHTKHSVEPSSQVWVLFWSNSFGSSISQSLSKGATWKTSQYSLIHPWEVLSQALSGSERNFCSSDAAAMWLMGLLWGRTPLLRSSRISDSHIPNTLTPATQTSLLHPGHQSFSDAPPATLRDHFLLGFSLL